MDEIYEKIESFILTSGGSVFDCFTFMDDDDSSFIDKKEFKAAVSRIVVDNLSSKQV